MKNRYHIVLVEPEIPQNTGNIARLCAATKSLLHVIHPLGFSFEDKYVRRAGLDYWPYLELTEHLSWNDCVKHLSEEGFEISKGDFAFFSTKAKSLVWSTPKSTKVLVFGKETAGLPSEMHLNYSENFFRIPMYHSKVRSLNLANSVSIALYNQLGANHSL